MKVELIQISSVDKKLIKKLEEAHPDILTACVKAKLEKLRERRFVFPESDKKNGESITKYLALSEVVGVLKEELKELEEEHYKRIEVTVREGAITALELKKKDPGSEDFTSYIPSGKDFTFYLPRQMKKTASPESPEDKLEAFFKSTQAELPLQSDGKAVETLSYDCKIWLWNGNTAAQGRALVCPCREGAQWSITFRKQAEFSKQDPPSTVYLNDENVIPEILYELIFRSNSSERGIIVITGRTGTGKSEIARQLVNTYSQKHEGDERRPHVITFEDPIEKYFDEKEGGGEKEGWEKRDYSPREKGKDAVNVQEAVNNALRQTPKVMFVGETREPKEWQQLLEFAGTGHLVITTAHAGSLVETMANILRATDTKTATERSAVADRIFALVHLRRDKVRSEDKDVQIIVPALWRRTPTGIKALMAEGLSSLLPNFPASDRGSSYSSIGRYWFAHQLIENKNLVLTPAAEIEIKRKTLEWDMEGI